MQISDNVFVVTGAGNGMGRQVALALVRGGAGVAAVDLDEAGLAETKRLAGATGTTVSTHVVNVTDRDAVAALPSLVVSVHGQIDGLVNIAGIAKDSFRVVIGADARLLDTLARISAMRATGFVAKQMKSVL